MAEMEIVQERTASALVVIPQDREERKNLFEIDGGIGPSLAKLKEFVTKTVLPDATTEKGREDIKSFVRKLVKTRTGLEAVGKELADEAKSVAKIIDANRKLSRDTIEALEAQVLKPVTDWETAEKARKDRHAARIDLIFQGSGSGGTAAEIREMLKSAKGLSGDSDTWEEFAEEYRVAIAQSVERLTARLAEREKYEAEQAELAQLRAEKEERDRVERERIEAEAAQRREEEAKRRALEAEERRRREIEAAAERARQEERERLERAAREKEAAAARVRQEEERRWSDAAHRATINKAAASAITVILDVGSATQADLLGEYIVEAIAEGKIPNVSIRY